MEFPFDVNQVLPFEITIINGDYRVLNPGQPARIPAPERLTCIIDAIGDASYKAQGLHGAVTTARKLRTSEHRLYIIKKADDNSNRGSVIGILKVGPKHLYIYDTNGQVHERTPLCVLDFYVHESRQRLGYGRQLFDTMLNFERCAPYELAIDRPSNKCLAFLHKHYNLSTPIHQVNNYVVYQAFFNQSSETTNGKSSSSKQRTEAASWLMPSQRPQNRLAPEPRDMQQRATLIDENHLLENRRQMTRTGQDRRTGPNEISPQLDSVSPIRTDRQLVSYYSTSYGRHYNHNPALQEPPDKAQSARYTPRSYSQVFHQRNSNQHLSRNGPGESSGTNDYRRTMELTPNLPKPNSSLTQQTPKSSSTWRIFGIPQLLN